MKHITCNYYIDTFCNFLTDVENNLKYIKENNIKYVLNLTECNLLSIKERLLLAKNGIKSHNFFTDGRLIMIKTVPPEERTEFEKTLRIELREKTVLESVDYLKETAIIRDNILLLCNQNNVLSQLFTFILMSIDNKKDQIEALLNDTSIVDEKNKADIKTYLDKYLDIYYNKINETQK